MKSILPRSVACAILLAYTVACAKLPPPVAQPSEVQRSNFGKVAVVSVKIAPDAEFIAPNIGRGSSAAKGAGGGALQGAATAVDSIGSMGSCSGSICALQILIIPAFALAGAIVGGIAGATDAIPSETAGQIEQQIKDALIASNPQSNIRHSVIMAMQNEGILSSVELTESDLGNHDQEPFYRNLQKKEIDTVLEVGVTRLGLIGSWGGGGGDPLLALAIQTKVRMISIKKIKTFILA